MRDGSVTCTLNDPRSWVLHSREHVTRGLERSVCDPADGLHLSPVCQLLIMFATWATRSAVGCHVRSLARILTVSLRETLEARGQHMVAAQCVPESSVGVERAHYACVMCAIRFRLSLVSGSWDAFRSALFKCKQCTQSAQRRCYGPGLGLDACT